MSGPIPGKWAWPELVGAQATLAATTIAHERPDVFVEVLLPGSPPIGRGFNPKRVRLYIDDLGLVFQLPFVGWPTQQV